MSKKYLKFGNVPKETFSPIHKSDAILGDEKSLSVFGYSFENCEGTFEVITHGNCIMCGKELTEGLFFCKECEVKISQVVLIMPRRIKPSDSKLQEREG